MRRALALSVLVLLAALALPTAPARADSADPPFDVPVSTLDAATDCDAFTHVDHEPVLLVHGTFTYGHEQYDWTYAPYLRAKGYDVCIVTYPDRGLGDMQVSAEYVARAVQRIHAASGRKVDVIGHSQGAVLPRWAIKWWPSVRDAVDDFVMQAGPNHGTSLAAGIDMAPPIFPAVFWQFSPTSKFVAALNAGDETPGTVDYTSLYSTNYDELVAPAAPVPTAGLDWGHEGPNVRNLAIQEVCPDRFVDHATIGTIDLVAMALTVDALSHPGPVDPERAGGASLCGLGLYMDTVQAAAIPGILALELTKAIPANFYLGAEPALKPYALPLAATEPVVTPPEVTAAPLAAAAGGSAPVHPVTGWSPGGAMTLAAALLAIAIASRRARLLR